MRNLVITGQKIRNKFLFIILLIFSACSENQIPKGAYWKGDADFMHVTSDTMDMVYAVDVVGNEIFLEGFYEVIKKNTDTVIYRLEVKELEFGKKQDGKSFCRIWGYVDSSSILSYLYAQDCHALN